MKLIIDIPDNDYIHIKEYYEKNDTVEATYSYIYHGIPFEESFINKPCISEGVCHEDKVKVLDKIRAEIEQEYKRLGATRADETLELGECLGLKMSLKIIDKYRNKENEES